MNNGNPQTDDGHAICFLHFRDQFYLSVKLAPGICPLCWARISRRIGQLDPTSFAELARQLDEDFFPHL